MEAIESHFAALKARGFAEVPDSTFLREDWIEFCYVDINCQIKIEKGNNGGAFFFSFEGIIGRIGKNYWKKSLNVTTSF